MSFLLSLTLSGRCFLAGGWLWTILGNPSPSFGGSTPQNVYRKALPSVMTLEVENQKGEKYIGSAVMVLADDVALTAWHVVSDAQFVHATFADGTRVRAVGSLSKDGDRDLALIKLERPLPGRRAELNIQLQPVATRTYVIGAPKGYAFSISDGLISQIRRVDGFLQYQVSCPISPGNSGGPLLDDRGRVLAIVSWTKSDAQNISFAIPSREVLQLQASGKFMSWTELRSTPQTPFPSRLVEGDFPSELNFASKGSAAPNYSKLNRALEKRRGKKVEITVRGEDGLQEHIWMMVPANLNEGSIDPKTH